MKCLRDPGHGGNIRSHPTGVRGLKFAGCLRLVDHAVVAPHWGAWIEIFNIFRAEMRMACRTPLGCVD